MHVEALFLLFKKTLLSQSKKEGKEETIAINRDLVYSKACRLSHDIQSK